MTERYRIVPIGLDSWGIQMYTPVKEEKLFPYIDSYKWTGRAVYKLKTEEVITGYCWWPMGWAVHKNGHQFLTKQFSREDGTYDLNSYRRLGFETTVVFSTKNECKKIIDGVLNKAKLKRERQEAIALRMKTVLPEEYP